MKIDAMKVVAAQAIERYELMTEIAALRAALEQAREALRQIQKGSAEPDD